MVSVLHFKTSIFAKKKRLIQHFVKLRIFLTRCCLSISLRLSHLVTKTTWLLNLFHKLLFTTVSHFFSSIYIKSREAFPQGCSPLVYFLQRIEIETNIATKRLEQMLYLRHQQLESDDKILSLLQIAWILYDSRVIISQNQMQFISVKRKRVLLLILLNFAYSLSVS